MARRKPTAWLVAAENGAIPGGKVGGVGDVIRDLPLALARAGWKVRVVVPSYGAFHRAPGAKLCERISGRFRGQDFEAAAWTLPGAPKDVEQVVIDHSLLCPAQPGEIYHIDSEGHPYETDANKFSLFCAVVAAWLEQVKTPPRVVHLHDWHTGLLPFLRGVAPARGKLARVRMVLTIHNLAYQGVRPLSGHAASLVSWFPEHAGAAAMALDPADPHLVNFMAAAIRGADAIATVSPTYAKEILRPNDPASGFHGGEGLQGLLTERDGEGCLSGILNGCEYPDTDAAAPAWPAMVDAVLDGPGLLDRLPALRPRLNRLREARPKHVLTSIGRIVGQKVSLLLEHVPGHTTALDAILEQLGEDGVFLLLGSGEPELEDALRAVSQRRDNFLFLRGYAESLSEMLYQSGDLFIMPSSFEPCGISQMLAMRAGQPCLVHAVGGLADTVEDGVSGFVFEGPTPAAQARALVEGVARALALRSEDPGAWEAMCQAAAARRFSWDLAAERTIETLYAR